jgi:hypothetical protein
MLLKRKFIAKLLGVPNLKSVSIITSSDISMKPEWPTLENAPFIGMSIELEDGTKSETMIETLDL